MRRSPSAQELEGLLLIALGAALVVLGLALVLDLISLRASLVVLGLHDAAQVVSAARDRMEHAVVQTLEGLLVVPGVWLIARGHRRRQAALLARVADTHPRA
jgi:hypothetical protein